MVLGCGLLVLATGRLLETAPSANVLVIPVCRGTADGMMQRPLPRGIGAGVHPWLPLAGIVGCPLAGTPPQHPVTAPMIMFHTLAGSAI